MNKTLGSGFVAATATNGLTTWIGLGGGGVAGALMTINPGNITATQGDIIATLGDITATAGDIVAVAGDISATAGSVSAATTVTAGTDLVSTAGDVVITSAANGVVMGSGASILSGAGDPNAVVVAGQGSLYLRTGGATASEILYVNTDGISAWSAVTVP
jgi:hypothetical protein